MEFSSDWEHCGDFYDSRVQRFFCGLIVAKFANHYLGE
jgi:hypothetical protein